MKNLKLKLVVAAAVAVILPMRAMAAGESETATRVNHPIGAYATMWGDPFPALLGVNIAYNVYDFLRLNAGVGTDKTDKATATTFGLGAKAMVPGWAVTPVAGLNWSADNVTGTDGKVDIRGIQRGGSRIYGSVGLDWTTKIGLNLGAGYNQSLAKNGGGSGYLQAGFFL